MIKILGASIVKGMSITLWHLIQTFIEDIKILLGIKPRPTLVKQGPEAAGIFTVLYPEQKLEVPERMRVLPMLIYEEPTGDLRCTACGICAKVCPPQCIWIVQAKGPDGKFLPKAQEFSIDIDVCMGCGFCAEFCPFDSIKMDHNFELSSDERRQSHVAGIQTLQRSTAYYAQTHPRAWALEQAKPKKGART